MQQNKFFWQFQMVALLAFYGFAAYWLSQGHGLDHKVVKIAAIVFATHLLEIPVAFLVLKDRQPNPLHVIAGTLVFGALWWLPAKRGIFAVH